MKLLILKGIAGAVWEVGENELTHWGRVFVAFRFESQILGQSCSQGAVNKSAGEQRGGQRRGAGIVGALCPWDQVRVKKAAGRNPIFWGEDEMDSHIMARGWKEVKFKAPSRIILRFWGSTTFGKKPLQGSQDIKSALGPAGGDGHDHLQESAALGAEQGTCDLLTPKEFLKDLKFRGS